MPKKTKPPAKGGAKRARKASPTELFPMPGDPPKWHEPRNEADEVAWSNALDEYATQVLAHRAVHTNDPELRAYMAAKVILDLREGRPIAPTATKWLMFVLMQLVVPGRPDRLPHLSIGNAVKRQSREEDMRRLVRYEAAHPPRPREKQRFLDDAAVALRISVAKVRDLYYSDEYDLWRRAENSLSNTPPDK